MSEINSRLATDQLPEVLRKVAGEIQNIVGAMADDNCLAPVLVLANDLGDTQVFLLHGTTSAERDHHIRGCIEEFKMDNRLVAICYAVEAWMCDESRFRSAMNLDVEAAVEHLLSTGVDEEAAPAIATHVIRNLIMNMAHMYHILYGDLALFPSSYEGIPFQMESLWGVHQRRAEIIRGVDEMRLEFDNGWRVLSEPGSSAGGTYTDLLQLEPPTS